MVSIILFLFLQSRRWLWDCSQTHCSQWRSHSRVVCGKSTWHHSLSVMQKFLWGTLVRQNFTLVVQSSLKVHEFHSKILGKSIAFVLLNSVVPLENKENRWVSKIMWLYSSCFSIPLHRLTFTELPAAIVVKAHVQYGGVMHVKEVTQSVYALRLGTTVVIRVTLSPSSLRHCSPLISSSSPRQYRH